MYHSQNAHISNTRITPIIHTDTGYLNHNISRAAFGMTSKIVTSKIRIMETWALQWT